MDGDFKLQALTRMIPLSKVIASGDETSVHSLNRPDDIYSGHVKVSMKWDSKQLKGPATKSAYPEAFVPCARYDPNAPATKPPTISVDDRRGSTGDIASNQQDEYGVPDTPERKAHQRSSSYPSRAYNFTSGYSPAASPSSARGHQPKGSYDGSYGPPSNGHPPRSPGHTPGQPSSSPGHASHGQPPSSPGSNNNGFSFSPISSGSQGYPSNGQTVEVPPSPRDNGPVGAAQNGHPHSPHGRGSAPHVPYVANQGHQGLNFGAHAPYQKQGPTEADPASLDSKLPDDLGTSKMSRARKAEMEKLAELSRLTESAKYLSTGFAHPQHGQQPQHVPSPRVKNDTNPPQQQQTQVPGKPRNEVLPSQQQQLQGTKVRNDIIPSQQHQQAQNSQKPRSQIIPSQQQQQQQLQISSKPRNEIVPSQVQQPPGPPKPKNYIISQQQQFQSSSRPNNHIIPSQQQQLQPSTKSRLEASVSPQVAQAPPKPGQIQVFQGPVYDGVQQKSQSEVPNRVQQRTTYGMPQRMVHTPLREQHDGQDLRQGTEVKQERPNQLQIVTHRAEAEKPPQNPGKLDKKAEKAARKAEKELQKAEKEAQKAGKGKDGHKGEKPERESHVSHIRNTLRMLRKTSKIFR